MNKQEIINSIDSAIKRRYERFDRLFVKAKGVGFEEAENGLYRYEKSVTDEARRIAVYIVEKGGSWEEWWKKLSDGCNDSYDFVQNLIKDGYTGWWDGHSGNSGSASVHFARCLLSRADLFEYLHGALSPLVGDAGYYDDRSDLPKDL